MLCHIVCSSCSLTGICKAHLKYIVLSINYIGGRCRRSESKNSILICFWRNRNRRTCSYRTHKDFHACINKVIVCIYRSFPVWNVILRLKLDLNAALSIDFINSNFSAAHCSCSVNSIFSRKRSDTSDKERVSFFLRLIAWCKHTCACRNSSNS